MFHAFPYTNFHDLNLDWLLQQCKEISDNLDTLTARVNNLTLPETYLITPQQFGALGDGTHDDTSAFTRFRASSGGIKYIPKGDYLVNGTVLSYTFGQLGDETTFQVDDPIRDPDQSKSFIVNGRRSQEATPSGGGSTLGANLRLASQVHYVDDTTSGHDNIIVPSEGYMSTKVTGYTRHDTSASQNVTTLYLESSATTNGALQSSALTTNLHLRQGTDGLSEAVGNRGASIYAFTRNHIGYANGGSAVGAVVTMHNYDTTGYSYALSQQTGRNMGGILVRAGGSAHAAYGIRIEGSGSAGSFAPIKIAPSAVAIRSADGDMVTAGAEGSHAIDMAAFNDSAYPQYALEIGRAGRTIKGRQSAITIEPGEGQWGVLHNAGDIRCLLASDVQSSRQGIYFAGPADPNTPITYSNAGTVFNLDTLASRDNVRLNAALWRAGTLSRNLVLLSVPPYAADGTALDLDTNPSGAEFAIVFDGITAAPGTTNAYQFRKGQLLLPDKCEIGSSSQGVDTLHVKVIPGSAAETYLQLLCTSFNPQFGWTYTANSTYRILEMIERALVNLNNRVTHLEGNSTNAIQEPDDLITRVIDEER